MSNQAKEVDAARAVHQFVVSALERVVPRDGVPSDTRNYRILVDQVSNQSNSEALTRWYRALAKCVSLFEKFTSPSMESLTNAIFSFDWTVHPEECLMAYSDFLASIVSANGSYVQPTLRFLVASLTITEMPEDAPHDINDVHGLIHDNIGRTISLVPTSVTYLSPMLRASFPHQRKEVSVQQTYVKNLLRIAEYASVLRDKILALIVERLIHIDVEINPKLMDGRDPMLEAHSPMISDGEEEDDDFHDDSGLLFRVEVTDETDSPVALKREKNGMDMEEVSLEEEKKGEEENGLTAMAVKLDAMMQLMFEYLRLLFSVSYSEEGEALQDQVFGSLLRVFEGVVLRTHKSKYVQFLLFFYCASQRKYAEMFLRRLLEKAFDKDAPSIDRQNAAAYVASFVARAAFLRHASATVSFELLIRWMHGYVEIHQEHSLGIVGPIEAKPHMTFYGICQAVMYIFVHRHSDLLGRFETDVEKQHQLRKYNFQAIVDSDLNPLRFCDQGLVRGFSVLCHKYKAADCFSVLRRYRLMSGLTLPSPLLRPKHNSPFQQGRPDPFTLSPQHSAFNNNTTSSSATAKEWRSQPTSSLFGQDDHSWEIDLFLPFDPYTLPESGKYVNRDNIYLPLWNTRTLLEEAEESLIQARTLSPVIRGSSSSLAIPISNRSSSGGRFRGEVAGNSMASLDSHMSSLSHSLSDMEMSMEEAVPVGSIEFSEALSGL